MQKMDRARNYSPRGRSMSISPEPPRRDSPGGYRHRSRSNSRSPNYKRHNGYRSPAYHKKNRKYFMRFNSCKLFHS